MIILYHCTTTHTTFLYEFFHIFFYHNIDIYSNYWYNYIIYLIQIAIKKGGINLTNGKHPVTLSLKKSTVKELDNLVRLSKTHTTRTMLVEDVLSQFIKMYNQFDHNKK